MSGIELLSSLMVDDHTSPNIAASSFFTLPKTVPICPKDQQQDVGWKQLKCWVIGEFFFLINYPSSPFSKLLFSPKPNTNICDKQSHNKENKIMMMKKVSTRHMLRLALNTFVWIMIKKKKT